MGGSIVIRVSKVLWVVFWTAAAFILGCVMAYQAINWYIGRHPRVNALNSPYVGSTLSVEKPDLYTITSYGAVRLQLTASDAFHQWGDNPMQDADIDARKLQGSQ